MFDMVDTLLSHGRALIVCSFLQESSKIKESRLHEIWTTDTAFLLGGVDLDILIDMSRNDARTQKKLKQKQNPPIFVLMEIQNMLHINIYDYLESIHKIILHT